MMMMLNLEVVCVLLHPYEQTLQHDDNDNCNDDNDDDNDNGNDDDGDNDKDIITSIK